MKADSRFLQQPREFWANVRTISQALGYTERATKAVRIPNIPRIRTTFAKLGLSSEHLFSVKGVKTPFGTTLLDYFEFRANILNNHVRTKLMDRAAAEAEFASLRASLNPKCPLPLNKQKGAKKNHAYLTGMVNMLVAAAIGNLPCDYDPKRLTTFTRNERPYRTLSRRVDGAFPTIVNPIAIWEVKEYYYTTTFGSRVADGVYETLLDGMELEELRLACDEKPNHILIVDDFYTWWGCGRSYLCRIVDMLHMGYVDEVLFGREVITEIPRLAAEWAKKYNTSSASTP